MNLNGFTQCSPCPQSKGQWKNPYDRSVPGYRGIEYWVDFARVLERGRFDALFFADVHGTYDVYENSRQAAVRHGVQIPCHDPTVLIPALAREAPHLGFASTYSTTYHAPYHTAKLFSTLDHLTVGRVGWNVVTSYLRDAETNGLGAMLPHDERYDRADEYLEVVYKLWEGSWEEDAVIYDRERDILTDPAKVHEIRHEGKYYQVRGPHMCEPSPQRTPVIYQAGSSSRGLDFAARHGEALFVVFPTTAVCRRYTDELRERVERFGRARSHVKILAGVAPIVGATEEEARRKHEWVRGFASPQGALALFGGWTGIDLSTYGADQKIEHVESQQMQFLAQYFSSVDPTREWTLREISAWLSIASVCPVFVGDYRHVADELERWVEEGGVDGFNILPVYSPGSLVDFVDLVVPELQRRGVFRKEYEGSTLREYYFGPGSRRIAADHPAAAFRFAEPRRGTRAADHSNRSTVRDVRGVLRPTSGNS
jgi:FMN-dependent oxidoreductase (nitrilotriacetate monooxygenase family)